MLLSVPFHVSGNLARTASPGSNTGLPVSVALPSGVTLPPESFAHSAFQPEQFWPLSASRGLGDHTVGLETHCSTWQPSTEIRNSRWPPLWPKSSPTLDCPTEWWRASLPGARVRRVRCDCIQSRACRSFQTCFSGDPQLPQV